ncbi:hypothetical protein ACNKF0_09555 [Nocardioides sp. T5]|uniref:hypothetical protein n=1 Tax=Nocardioides sp. T5 TaxID=3400182 RepID=UPI003A8C6D7D
MTDSPSRSGFPPSPVPSDARLWPGELPFTAFGHLGPDRLDLRVFDQDLAWIDRTGRPHLLAEMSEEYVSNVIAFLVELREQYFVDTQRRWFIQSLGDQLLFGEPGCDVIAVAAGGPTWGEMSAETWLEATPLMRALRRRVA